MGLAAVYSGMSKKFGNSESNLEMCIAIALCKN